MPKAPRGSPRAKLDRSYRNMLKKWAGAAHAWRHVLKEKTEWGGPLLRNIRTELDLTQTEMGEILGVSKFMVCKVEHGAADLSLDMLLRLDSLVAIEKMAKDKGKWKDLVNED